MNEETSRKRILVVDDEEPVGRLLARILKKVHRECCLALSAEEARRILKEEIFDLILCDIRLPGESGISLVEHVISHHPDTAVIMVTAEDDPETVEKALEIGAYGYIVKPFQRSEVIINVASALRRQRLEVESRNYREDLERMVADRTAKLEQTLDGIIQVVAHTVESRDPYTAGHQVRVAGLACAIAEEMECPQDQVKGIRMAGSIHDLGKITVPSEILSKPIRLSDIEFALIKTHPQVGYDILKDIDFPWPVAEITYQHHERLDGSGYPRGLKGEEIIPEARIMSVADVVEAMASHRPYRPAVGLEKALEEIETNAGSLYDPEAVKACLTLFRQKGFSFDG
ncbi:MAG: response regulator [Deltaproteobacteria bacterium]|nr:response regulator [Deltaproteobacteria bacterium]